MCFYYEDYDWNADVVETEKRFASEQLNCNECGDSIPIGSPFLWVYQQEHEVCSNCEDDDPECEHSYGEDYTYHQCETCGQLLKAIEAVEKDEGCPPHTSQPVYGQLEEVFVNKWDYDAEKYAARVAEMYPELANHRWIAPLLNKAN